MHECDPNVILLFLIKIFFMALIKYSALVAGMSGKLNGSVAAHNRYGSYLRNKSPQTNPQSTGQQNVRSGFSMVSQIWSQTLNQSQRDSWNQGASEWPRVNKFGDVVTPSGFALFMELNNNLVQYGLSAIEDVPTKQLEPANTFRMEETFEIVIDPAYAGTFKIAVMATAPTSVGRETGSVKNKYRIVDRDAVFAGSPATYDAETAYVATFGSLPVTGNWVIFWKVFFINPNSGQKTTPVILKSSYEA